MKSLSNNMRTSVEKKENEVGEGIGSEDTLKMIMKAMKSETGGVEKATKKPRKKKEEAAEEEIKAELETVEEDSNDGTLKKTSLKKAKKSSKKKPNKTPRIDGITRFFNDYGESPHL